MFIQYIFRLNFKGKCVFCKAMLSLHNIKDVIRCHLCDTPVPLLYCDVCHINLCKACAADHLLDDSVEHKVVPIKQKHSSHLYTKLTTYANNQCEMHDEQCELYCKQCDIPICSCCSLSNKHLGHDKCGIIEAFKSKIDDLQRDLQEFEKRLLPKYQDIVSSIKVQYDDLETKSKTLIKDIHKQGADWHKEVDTIINRKKSEVSEMQNKNIDALNKQEYDITLIISEITQIIGDLKELLESKDVYKVSAYKSRNAEFRKLPTEIKFTVPSFISEKINTEQLYEQFGSLSGSPLTTEFEIPIQTSLAMPSSPGKPFLYDPQIIATLETGYDNLNHVTCLCDDELWTQGNSNIMKLYDLQGNLQQSIKTKSGNNPYDIAVTKDGDLAYIDSKDKTVNLIKKTKMQKVSRPRMHRWRKKDTQEIHKMIELKDWKPLRFCITNSGDFLITMTCDDKQETKLTRYSGFTEKQNIQFDDNEQPLYSYGSYIVYVKTKIYVLQTIKPRQ